MIHIVGVGPGDPAYITEQGATLIAAADLVAGFNLPLETAGRWIKGEPVLLDYRNQEERLAALGREAATGRRCVVCAQGDPNFSGRELIDRVRGVAPDVEVVPGVSSVQVACIRAGLELDRALFLSFHKRGTTELERGELLDTARAGSRHIVALPRPWDFMPPLMAALLMEREVPGSRVATVYERLTLPDERVITLPLVALAASTHEFSDLSIFVLPAP